MNGIELRSKHARGVIGPIPRSLLIAGIIVTLLIFAALLAALLLLPAPDDPEQRLISFIISSLI